VLKASNVGWLAPSEDRQMWRLLLARLHPDAGGDHDLFAFACAIREELSAGVRTTPGVVPGDNVQGIDARAPPSSRTGRRRWSTGPLPTARF
jgi:hypothetical protein